MFSPGDPLPCCEIYDTPDVVRIEQNLVYSAHAQEVGLPDFQFLKKEMFWLRKCRKIE